MKFAHDFDAALRREEYPQEWLDSAISYRQLKKCINKVQRELQGLGLDPRILEQLWQSIDNNGDGNANRQVGDESSCRPYLYYISDEVATFKPKLTVAIHPRDGTPIDAWLSPETKDFLRSLPRTSPVEKQSYASISASSSEIDVGRAVSTDLNASDLPNTVTGDSSNALETVEIPLTSDSEFFQILKCELDDLHQLQEKQQKQLTTQIVKLGSEITTLTESTSRKSKPEVQAWREVFRLYLESQVFFSTAEESAGSRSSSVAQEKFKEFSNGLASDRKQLKLSTSGKVALGSFIQINGSLLQFMKFQEINNTALTKIMKKFEKRTALHREANLPTLLASQPFVAQDLAKAACFTIQEKLLQIVPQLNDYLCPVCFSISFKPIRLRCNHVFCIRCLIVMQRAKQDHCPLCREEVVMEASGEHLDKQLMAFLEARFPAEVRVKRKENERAAQMDLYGQTHGQCTTM